MTRIRALPDDCQCGEPRTALCDAMKPDGEVCNAPLCDKHKILVGDDTHVCPYHNEERFIQTAIISRDALRYFRQRSIEEGLMAVPGVEPSYKNRAEVDSFFDSLKTFSQKTRSENPEPGPGDKSLMFFFEGARKRRGISIRKAAGMLGIHPVDYCDYQTERKKIPREHREKLMMQLKEWEPGSWRVTGKHIVSALIAEVFGLDD